MPIYFKTAMTQEMAFQLIEQRISEPGERDGYLDVLGTETTQSMSWSRGTSVSQFKATITDALRSAWETAPFWLVYKHQEDRDDLGINEIRKAAITLTRPYNSVTIVTLSLLERHDSSKDVELIFLCFRDEVERRNFRVRYEGKFVANQAAPSSIV